MKVAGVVSVEVGLDIYLTVAEAGIPADDTLTNRVVPADEVPKCLILAGSRSIGIEYGRKPT